MAQIDYTAPADFYPGRNMKNIRSLQYRRFQTAAEALRFAIEEMPDKQLKSSILEVDEERFEGANLRQLYDHDAYPLSRKTNF
jgi:hypothetical protein